MTAHDTTPRDPAVDAILTAETLYVQFQNLVPRLTSLLPRDVSTAMGEAQSLYPELWVALDRARAVLRERGVDVPAFDETRARQPAAMLGFQVHTSGSTAETAAAFIFGGALLATINSIGSKAGEANASGLKDARTAMDALRAAMPEVDWKTVHGQEARETAVALDGLARAGRKKLWLGLAGLAVALLTAIGLVKILQSSRPPTEEELAEKRAAEYDEARGEISELNEALKQNPCDARAAERRVSLFQANNRSGTARKLAKKFLDQCGDNPKLRAVADAR